MAQRNTRLILRNDSSTNWKISEEVILLKGEMGLEFLDDDSIKIKIGDGATKWKDLKYYNDFSEIIERLNQLENKVQSEKTGMISDEILILNCGGAVEIETNGN